MQTTLAIAGMAALGGCANYTQVTADGDGSYRLTATGVSYTMSLPGLTAASRDQANAWCAAQDKDMQLRQQARSWNPLQVELNFRCVPHQEGALGQSSSLTTLK